MDFYFDENFSHVMVEAMNVLEQAYGEISIYHTKKAMIAAGFTAEGSIKDQEVIPWIAKRKGILVTMDKRMTENKALYAMLHKYKLSVMFTPHLHSRHWDQMIFIMKNWEKMKKAAASKKAGYDSYFFTLKSDGTLEDWADRPAKDKKRPKKK